MMLIDILTAPLRWVAEGACARGLHIRTRLVVEPAVVSFSNERGKA